MGYALLRQEIAIVSMRDASMGHAVPASCLWITDKPCSLT